MGSRYLHDLADVCRYTGYPVVEVDGWPYRARGSGGYDPGYPNHVIVHHTASGPGSDPMNGGGDVSYCAFGHPDAPVGNLYLSRDGTVHVMAGGAANTNGTGTDPCGLVPDDGMNSRSVAIEAGNDGVGEPWPAPQQDSYRRLCAVLCAAYGIGVAQIHAHFEWAPGRKIDPAGPSDYATGAASWNMAAFRADVADVGEIPPPTTEDDPMYLATLSNGDVVLVGSTVRPVSGEELTGPYAGLPRYTPDPSSYWHDWLRSGADEYARRVGM